jgi:hypothetical protein
MESRIWSLAALLVAGTAAAAACTAQEATGPASLATDGPEVAAPAAVEAALCRPTGEAATEAPGWPLEGSGDAQILPVVMSSSVSVGPNRFLYNVLDPAYRQLAAPDMASSIAFYAIERDADTPSATVEASYLSSGLGRGLYRAAVDLDCVGEWGAEVSMELADGSVALERLRFQVHPGGSTPSIGEAAPRSDSLTAQTMEEAVLISTDQHPEPAAYDKTVAETVTSGRPSLVFFATPAFCQTGYCGPTVELVKMVAREHDGEVEFVNVEPYQLHMTENGLQPVLDEAGHLQPLDYGIPVEPYLFIVDAGGDVFAKFEGIVGGDELRAAIVDVLAA